MNPISELPTIRILPATLANQIAAGEVVERPSSVVKELLENSLDAGTSQLEVRIEAGGKRLIQVMDNGHGMTGPQLRLALLQHATSKLTSLDGLSRIQTLGFRGEALASIASVSHLTLESRPAMEETGMALVMEAGREVSLTPVAMPPGTRITVRRLFQNTPARLKFLKSDQTETSHVMEYCQRMALAYPEISFRLVVNEREVMNIRGGIQDRSLQARLAVVFGPTFPNQCLSLQGEQHELIRISGWLGLPVESRPNGSAMHLFVNGRWVRDRVLTQAIREVYREVLPRDRYPALVVFLEMPPEEVDVNVHPAKLEVRFRNTNMVFAAVRRILGGILAGEGLTTVLPNAPATAPAVVARLPAAASQPVFPPTRNTSPAMPRLPFSRPPLSLQETFDPGLSSPPVEENASWGGPLGQAIGQIQDTYILAHNDQGLVLVDQHAAHERIVYEKLKQSCQTRKPLRQNLLIPEIMKLTPTEAEKIRGWVVELAELGIVVEPFGPDTFVIRALPVQVAERMGQDLVFKLVDELERCGQSTTLETRRERALITLACHHSVRAGRRLSLADMNALLRQIEKTPMAEWCNHGRPTHIQITLAELEKMFHRR